MTQAQCAVNEGRRTQRPMRYRPNLEYNLGNKSFSVLNRGVRRMIVADEIRKCVAYVGIVDNHEKKHLLGTCFCVYRTFQHLATTYHGTWCVTARHVIEKIRATRDEMADDEGKM